MTIARIAAVLALTCLAACQTQPPAGPLESLSGMQLYERLCSSCHGPEARGDGPVALLIKTGVPDLTGLARRDGGEFPTEDVRRTIDGRFDRPAHGPRDMPVWGWRLYDASSPNDASERAQTDSMIDRLVEYLRSIQAG
jgi:mono/diheme cytochrome c family protein